MDASTHNVFVANNNGSSITAISPPADVSLSVSAPASAADGSQVTEQAKVANEGPFAAPDTITNLVIPAGLTLSSAPGAVVRSGTLVWVDASLAPGTSVIYRASFSVASNVHANSAVGGVAESAAYDPNPANNAAIALLRLG